MCITFELVPTCIGTNYIQNEQVGPARPPQSLTSVGEIQLMPNLKSLRRSLIQHGINFISGDTICEHIGQNGIGATMTC
jgi:hypothetical protein